MDKTYTLTVDTPEQGILRLELFDEGGLSVAKEDLSYEGVHVDNLLLTGVDNLLKTNTIEQSALKTVSAGSGIDKNSSLYRIVQSFGSAVSVSHSLGKGGARRRK